MECAKVSGISASLRRPAVLGLAAIAVIAQFAPAASLTWDTDLTTAGAQDGSGSWAASTTSFYNGSTNVAATTTDDVTFGASGTAGTVTLTGPQSVNRIFLGATLSGTYTLGNSGVAANTLTLNQTATDATYGSGTIIVNQSAAINNTNNISGVRGIGFATANQVLTLSGGQGTNFMASGAVGSPVGGNSGITFNGVAGYYGTASTVAAAAAIAQTSTVVLSSGTYGGGNSAYVIGIGNPSASGTNVTGSAGGVIVNAGATINSNSNFLVGSFGTASGLLTINGGTAGPIANNSNNFHIGRNMDAANQMARVIINSGAINVSGTNAGAGGTIILGNGFGAATQTAQLDINGGTVTVLTTQVGGTNVGAGQGQILLGSSATGRANANGSAILNITGGTTIVGGNATASADPTKGGIVVGGTATVPAQFNMSGGTLYLGSAGITTTTGNTVAITKLSGGTIGVSGTAGWNTTMALHLTGNVTFLAADSNAVSRDITISGALTDTGSFTKTGSGALSLSGVNTYNGDATINAGSLTLSGAAASELSDAGTLTLALGTTLNLNAAASTSETVNGLILNGTVIGPGIYTAAQLAALPGASGINFASASGETLTVLTSVPEPGSLAVLGLGAMAMIRRRR